MYLTETRSEADKGSQREPPPRPPLPPPPSTTNAGAPRKPRFGVEPGLLRDGMTVLLGKGVPAEGAAWKARCFPSPPPPPSPATPHRAPTVRS